MTSTEQTAERSPLDKALDLGVFAPLGLALEFRRVVPELAEAGRRQIAFSRSLGQAALRTMARSAAAKDPAGAKPAPTAAEQPARTTEQASTPSAAKKPAAKKPAAKKSAAKKPVAKKSAAKKPVAKKSAAKKSVAKKSVAKKPAAKSRAGVVAGYDDMTARQIIERSRSASAPQRAWMLDRETNGKGRTTVLRALNVSK